MASRKPKVGDPALIDGRWLTVLEVSGHRIKFGCEDAASCADRVAEIRAAARAEGDALAGRWEAYKTEYARVIAMPSETPEEHKAKRAARAANNTVRARLALDEDVYHAALQEELESVGRGLRIGANPADVTWVEAGRVVVGHSDGAFVLADVAGAWSLPGRLSPHVVTDDAGNAREVPREHRRQIGLATAHRAEKEG